MLKVMRRSTMAVNPLIPGALLILFVILWFVAGVVDGTRRQPAEARPASPEPSHEPNRELAHH
jgi:hypothetical protein